MALAVILEPKKIKSVTVSIGHVWMRELDCDESLALKNWCFWTMVLEKTLESLGLHGDPTSPSWRRSVLGVHWKDWCWSWNSNTLATSWEELTHWKRPWCWGGLGVGGEGVGRGWDGWMASSTRWTWVWVNSGSWWWTGRPGVLRFMGSQRFRHDWMTEPNWMLRKSILLEDLTIFIVYVPNSRVSNSKKLKLVELWGERDRCTYFQSWKLQN